MDLVYLILIGAGIIIMLLAFFLQRKTPDDAAAIPTQRLTDKAETEKSLQRLSKQFKQETALLSAEWQETRADLLHEIDLLKKRVEQLEQQWNERAAHAQVAASAEQGQANGAQPAAEDVDMLALRERYRRVFELSREGLSPDEIAKRLGAGRGEIDLIFALAQRNERGFADA
ncbi:DUF6115 domain-containing protein [Brevibacillus agri]|uniref:DUF6115 domain-containing protein n=1 Tax=Brevibacillus agri TaxID=51101 RepID=UPI001EE567F7|nr:RNA polymerase subunit sigma-70 [Brevibacillus agri]MCG5250739.1 RNA polymerase subunit sigma-70 [Brevibacillus agri]